MDGLTWLIMSWLIVGVLCYFMLAKVGTSQTAVTTGVNNTMIKSHTASSNRNNDQYSTDWLNDIIGWLFNNMHRVPDTLQAWITAMNEAAKKISIPGKFEVLFEGFSDNKNVTKAPRITDIRLQQLPNDHLIIKSKISVPEVNLRLMSSQRTGDRLLVTNFDAKIIDLHGEIELCVACIANQIYMMACFCGRPELDIELINRDPVPVWKVLYFYRELIAVHFKNEKIMDGLTWLIMSWLIVGVLCYFMLAKVGTSQTAVTTGVNNTMIKSHTASSNRNNDQYSTDWLNDIIGWLFNNMHRVPDTLQAWITAMNEAAKKISIPGKFEVLFEGFSDNKNVTKAPRITDIRLQQLPNDHLIIKSKISVPEVNLRLMSSQRTGDRLLVTNFDAKIIDLHGEIELCVACIANQIYMMACFCGRPELDIELINRDPVPTGTVSSTMVDEMIRKCLLSAVTNVSLLEPAGQCGRIATGIMPSNIFSTAPRVITTNVNGSDTVDSSGDMLATVTSTHEMMKRMN
ncbi:unnamed protein product, partial [Acanthocheilonema viteae]